MTAITARLSAGLPASLRVWLADPAHVRLLVLVGSAAGYGIGIAAALELILVAQGGLGYDSQAYWLAGQRVLHGQPLYGCVEVDCFGGYKYPPLFAQLWAPLTLMPALAFSWLWRTVCLLCVRWLAGSWVNVGLWLLVPFTISELSLANVTFPVAVAVVLTLRGRGVLAAAASALKFGPAFGLLYAWIRRPESRRSIVAGTVALAGITLVSYLADPQAWADYADSLLRSQASPMAGFMVFAFAPTGALDLALRLALAMAMTLVALRIRSERLVFTATVIAVPILALWRLAPLLVLPRLGRAE